MSSYRDVKSDNKVNVAHFSAYRLSPSNTCEKRKQLLTTVKKMKARGVSLL